MSGEIKLAEMLEDNELSDCIAYAPGIPMLTEAFSESSWKS